MSILVLTAGPSASGLCIPASQRPGRLGNRSHQRSIEEERRVQVFVRDNNVDQAFKVVKKKMQREGVFREMKLRGHYEKSSERRVREKAEAIRRARKLARKKLQREGLAACEASAGSRGHRKRRPSARASLLISDFRQARSW